VIRQQLQYHGALALRQDSQQGADLRVRFWKHYQIIAVGAQAGILFGDDNRPRVADRALLLRRRSR